MSNTIIMPQRIQRSREHGWRMPDNTIYVGRPTVFGNPFTLKGCAEAGYTGDLHGRCFEAFRIFMGKYWREVWQGEEAERYHDRLLRRLPELRGKHLACWCPLNRACHADVLIELANRT